MKRKLSTLAAVFIGCTAYMHAQGWNFGVEAGYVNNTMAVSEYKASARSGFKVGANARYTFSNNITLESGIDYLRKGATINGTMMLRQRISQIKHAEMDYLQIPIMAGYRFNLGSRFSIKPQIGAYYAVGIGGDSFITGWDTFGQPFEKRTSTFGGTSSGDYRPCNRNDGGLVFAADFAWKHIGLNIEYDLGLADVSHYGNGKQRTFSVSVAYWLFK